MRRQLRKQGLQGVAKEGAEKDGKDKILLDIAFRGRMLAPEKDRRCRDRCLLGCVCTCTALYVAFIYSTANLVGGSSCTSTSYPQHIFVHFFECAIMLR